MKLLSNTKCVHPVLGEIRDAEGKWHTGVLTYTAMARLVGTTTQDLIRRCLKLGIVEYKGERHRLTRMARQKCYGRTYKQPQHDRTGAMLCIDVILPEGMVKIVTNLEATNPDETDVCRLLKKGYSQSRIASLLGCSQQAVSKKIKSRHPHLTNWPILGSWE
ncbi:hypothetical protein [Pseudochrobactrum lubricantis]|uniref:hypothetical protein n=1 Tax=Pseudochrobactrum lubricantis TaxID=558172 RepID=UPI0035DF1B5D